MKKTVTLLLFFCIGLIAIQAQWQVTNPGTTNTLQKLYPLNNDTAFLTSVVILKTVNGGSTWVDKTPSGIPSGKNLTSISFGNVSDGLIAAQDSFLLKTTDNGETWSVIPFKQVVSCFGSQAHAPATCQFYTLYFLNKDTCFVTMTYTDPKSVKRAYVLRSLNQGASWDTVTSDFANAKLVTCTGIAFAEDKLTGYVVGAQGTVLKTTNGGASWTQLSIADLSGVYINDIALVNSDSVYLPTNSGIFKTIDGFSTVKKIMTDASQDFDIFSDTLFLSVGNSPKIYRSLDFGATWQSAINGGGTMFDVAFLNRKIYGLGSSGNLYTLTPDQLLDPIADFSIASQQSNVINLTNKSVGIGTYTWHFDEKTVSGNISSYEFSSLGDHKVFLKGDNAVGTDYSDTVTVTVSALGTQTWKNFEPLNDSKAVMAGNGTTLIYTEDGGSNWYKGSVPDSLSGHVSNDLAFLDASSGFASFSYSSTTAYKNGFLLKTTDAGKTWAPLSLDAFSDGSSSVTDIKAGQKIYFYATATINADTAYTVAQWENPSGTKHSYVFETTNAGNSWTITSTDLSVGYTGVFNAMKFAKDTLIGYIAGNKYIWKTTDGSSWTAMQNDSYGFVNDFVVIDKDTVYAATGNGILKTTDGFTTFDNKTTGEYAFDIIALKEGALLGGRDQSNLRYTNDYGVTWKQKAVNITASCFEFGLLNGTVYGLSSNGNIFTASVDNYLDPVAVYTVQKHFREVTFTNSSKNYSQSLWSFGDGQTSTVTNPVHSYSGYGDYTVKLIVSNSCQNDSLTATISVTKASQTISFDSITAKTYGDAAFDLSATASSGLEVSFSCSDPDVATITGKTVTITGGGTAVITALQAGDDTTEVAPDVTRMLVVNKADQTITFDSIPGKLTSDADFDLTATASSGLTVSYESSNTAVATIAGSTVTIVGEGTSVITASQAGDNNYNAAPNAIRYLVVTKDLGVKNQNADVFSVYPNPAAGGRVMLNIPAAMGSNLDLEVVGIDGRVLYRHNIQVVMEKTEVNLSLKAGIYQLRIISASQKSNVVKLIVR